MADDEKTIELLRATREELASFSGKFSEKFTHLEMTIVQGFERIDKALEQKASKESVAELNRRVSKLEENQTWGVRQVLAPMLKGIALLGGGGLAVWATMKMTEEKPAPQPTPVERRVEE